jgi:hypothetical protein
MAFKPRLLIKLEPSSLFTQPATIPNVQPAKAPVQVWTYQASADTVATVEASGYFVYFADWLNTLEYNNGQYLQVGDIIYCVCSDANVWLQVATIGSTITTVVAPVSAGSIVTSSIAAGAVTLPKLAAGITPSGITKFDAQYTTVGGAAAEAIAVAGALATDLAFVQLVNHGPNTVSVAFAVMTANTLTVTFSANPGAGAIINYQIIRAAS